MIAVTVIKLKILDNLKLKLIILNSDTHLPKNFVFLALSKALSK